MRTPDGEVVLEPGQGIQIPPGLPHQMANDSGGILRFLAISAPTTQGDRVTWSGSAALW